VYLKHLILIFLNVYTTVFENQQFCIFAIFLIFKIDAYNIKNIAYYQNNNYNLFRIRIFYKNKINGKRVFFKEKRERMWVYSFSFGGGGGL
jgi:hypothetical protein